MESNGSGGGGGGFDLAALANPDMLAMFVQMALNDPQSRASVESQLNEWLMSKGIYAIQIHTDYPGKGLGMHIFQGPDISRLVINMVAGEFGFSIAEYPAISEFSE